MKRVNMYNKYNFFDVFSLFRGDVLCVNWCYKPSAYKASQVKL